MVLEIKCIYSINYVLNNHIELYDNDTNRTIKKLYNNLNTNQKEYYTHLIVYEDLSWRLDNLMDLS